jgi:hypothetical protein
MKSFYDMINLMEEEGLMARGGQEVPKEQGPSETEKGLGNEKSPAMSDSEGETKHYMFFSNLKSIKEKVDAILAMDEAEVDRMLADGHDWASDHIATSKDDVEEVYNWLSGEAENGQEKMGRSEDADAQEMGPKEAEDMGERGE